MFYSGPVTGNFFERAGLPLPGAGPAPKKAPKKVAKKVSPLSRPAHAGTQQPPASSCC